MGTRYRGGEPRARREEKLKRVTEEKKKVWKRTRTPAARALERDDRSSLEGVGARCRGRFGKRQGEREAKLNPTEVR